MLFRTIKAIIHPLKTARWIADSTIERINTLSRQKKFKKKATNLEHQALFSKKTGISKDRYCSNEIIISLTSYSKRIHGVYLAIESIMQGSLKPNRIILWLSEKEFKGKTLPTELQNQVKRGLEICYCKDIRSFKKLIYTLKEYPNATIITIDDDAIYNFDFVKNLLESHKENPSCIYANRVHRIKKAPDGKIEKYLDWEWDATAIDSKNNDLFFTGVGGVLYPPHCLHEEAFNEDVFLKLCPTADDVWFNAMARLKGTKISKSITNNPNGEDYILNESVQYCALGLINNIAEHNQNDVQIKAIIEKYPSLLATIDSRD